MELTDKIMQFVRKYRFVVLVLLIGMALMLIPFGGSKNETTASPKITMDQPDIKDELEAIIRRIDGAGEVSVMLSIDTGISTVYQSDNSISSAEHGTSNQETVIITDENRTQAGLIQHVVYPKYRGAVIVCQGGDNPVVRLNVMEAVSRITGLGMDKISVLKMK